MNKKGGKEGIDLLKEEIKKGLINDKEKKDKLKSLSFQKVFNLIKNEEIIKETLHYVKCVKKGQRGIYLTLIEKNLQKIEKMDKKFLKEVIPDLIEKYNELENWKINEKGNLIYNIGENY